MDTHTGEIWEYDGWAIEGSDGLDSTFGDGELYPTWFQEYKWEKIMPGPNSGIIDTNQIWNVNPK